MRKQAAPARRVVIVGGGNIGFRLASELEDKNQVKLIERDSERARRVSELLNRTTVLLGDAADEELLLEENIDSVDVFAALTNSEEANILSAMLAKRLGAHKVMALINKPSYAELIESGSIDVAISPQTVTIGSLLAHVRRGDVVRVHSLRRGAAEAIEVVVHGDTDSSKVIGRRIEDIKLPQGTTLGAVVRGEDVIIAVSCVGIAVFLFVKGTYADFPTALRHATFNVVSIATDSGLHTQDYSLWPIFAPM
jgi:trk system potassium uptake protein TrkA